MLRLLTVLREGGRYLSNRPYAEPTQRRKTNRCLTTPSPQGSIKGPLDLRRPESMDVATRSSSEKISVDVKVVCDEAEAKVHVALVTDEVDTGAQLVAGTDIQVDPQEALRIRRKIDWHIMPLMCSAYDLRPCGLSTLTSPHSDILGTVHGQTYPRERCDLGAEVSCSIVERDMLTEAGSATGQRHI